MERSEWEEAVLKRDNYCCSRCNKKTTNVSYVSLGKKDTFEVSNGITICEECEEEFMSKNEKEFNWWFWETFINEKGKTLRKPIMKETEKNILTTEDIVKEVASMEDVGLSQKEVRAAINGLRNAIVNALKSGKKVQLTGFFTVHPIYRGERKANNIATHEEMLVPESVGVSIKSGADLKKATYNLDPSDFKTIK